LDTAHISTLTCDEMAGAKPRQHYSLRPRLDSLSLPYHDNYMCLPDCSFKTRMLYKQCYQNSFVFIMHLYSA